MSIPRFYPVPKLIELGVLHGTAHHWNQVAVQQNTDPLKWKRHHVRVSRQQLASLPRFQKIGRHWGWFEDQIEELRSRAM